MSVLYKHINSNSNLSYRQTMYSLSCWFLVALLFSVQCIQRQILYSRLDTQVTHSPAAVLLGDVDSVVHCAGLCFGDDNCAEFLYNQTDKQCIGLHCLKKGSYSYQYVVSASDQKLYFGKGNFFLLMTLFYNNSSDN